MCIEAKNGIRINIYINAHMCAYMYVCVCVCIYNILTPRGKLPCK